MYFLYLWISLLWTFYANGITKSEVFCISEVHPHWWWSAHYPSAWLNMPRFILLLMAIRAVSAFWLLRMTLLWTSVHKFQGDIVFTSLGNIPRSGIARSNANSTFNHLMNQKNVFLKWLPHFTFLPAAYLSFNFTSSATLILLFDSGHVDGCKVMSLCFDLHFPDD